MRAYPVLGILSSMAILSACGADDTRSETPDPGPTCAAILETEGTLGGASAAQAYCAGGMARMQSGDGWRISAEYQVTDDPADGALSARFWGTGDVEEDQPVTPVVGIVEVSSPDAPSEILCVGEASSVTRGSTPDKDSFTLPSLTRLGACPGGEATTDMVTAFVTGDLMTGLTTEFGGTLGGVALGGADGLTCAGRACEVAFEVAGKRGLLELKLHAPIGEGSFETMIDEAYLAYPLDQARVAFFCGGPASLVRGRIEGTRIDIEFTLAVPSALGSCPGTPFEGTLSARGVAP
ncbi:hypothetical protein [Polyangium mundeleinium]|uniref:Lipoprotein n=1 Tax=Polyangium mundeleinium TaxID=2995306 RepID=A0ABT5EP19_9BACT|nr:hypothetical protein [Polyangium mundeleinium]MDC0743092.1 hypothetical protein [Polyangium mundeleinium]